jgi:hypothetical protein
MPEYFIGVDLGQKHDFTAIAVVERQAGGLPHFLTPWTIPQTTYGLRHLERIQLGTPYPRVVERIGCLTRLPQIQQRSTLVVDATGVGTPVVDLLRQANLDCHLVAITITGGEHAHRSHGACTVPKRDLIATLELMLEVQELTIAAELPERRRLVEELMALQSNVTSGGHQSFGASGRAHDDLVLAVALACWQARKPAIGLQGHRIV